MDRLFQEDVRRSPPPPLRTSLGECLKPAGRLVQCWLRCVLHLDSPVTPPPCYPGALVAFRVCAHGHATPYMSDRVHACPHGPICAHTRAHSPCRCTHAFLGEVSGGVLIAAPTPAMVPPCPLTNGSCPDSLQYPSNVLYEVGSCLCSVAREHRGTMWHHVAPGAVASRPLTLEHTPWLRLT